MSMKSIDEMCGRINALIESEARAQRLAAEVERLRAQLAEYEQAFTAIAAALNASDPPPLFVPPPPPPPPSPAGRPTGAASTANVVDPFDVAEDLTGARFASAGGDS